MKITFKLYAGLTDYLPADVRTSNQLQMDLADDTPIAGVIERFSLPQKMVHLVLVNGVYVPPEQRFTHVLKEGDVLAIWPPIAGG
jgi:sulfur carrier protein ThiS